MSPALPRPSGCLADRQADVTATVGSDKVTLRRTSEQGDDGYYWFEGEYTVPSSGSGLTISATASLDGRTQTRTGGSFTVYSAEMLPEGDDSSTTVTGDMLTISGAQSFSGKQIQVTADYADVFIPAENDREEDYAAPYYYQMPKGTIDYVVSGPDSNNIYWLASGRKVSAAKSPSLLLPAPRGKIPSVRSGLSADSSCTYLTVSESWKVPFNIEVEDDSVCFVHQQYRYQLYPPEGQDRFRLYDRDRQYRSQRSIGKLFLRCEGFDPDDQRGAAVCD